jgi:hypothetical protein
MLYCAARFMEVQVFNAGSLLTDVPRMDYRMRVFGDSVELTERWLHRWLAVGWFRDEVDALAAAAERRLLRSAFTPELRRLDPFRWITERSPQMSGHDVSVFRRGTVRRAGRVLRLPCASYRPWL